MTREQALDASEFHENGCECKTGPRGGKVMFRRIWRRSGKNRVGIRNPKVFNIPIKSGLYAHWKITEANIHMFHLPEECPCLKSSSTI